MGKIGSESAINPLINVLENPEDPWRENAAEAWGKIGSMSAIDPLVKALKDPSDLVRTNAAKALGEISAKPHQTRKVIIALREFGLWTKEKIN